MKLLNLLYVVTILIVIGLSVQTVHANELKWLSTKEAKKTAQEIEAKKQKIISDIEKYLANFTTLKSRFIQTSTGAVELSEGELSISRPGKARWEYKTPSKHVVVINNGRLSYYDVELNQVSFADVPDTPLNILLTNKIDLKKNTKIIDVVEYESTIHATIADKKSENKFESLTLVFRKNPMSLNRLIRVNKDNQSIIMQFTNPKFDIKLKDSDFVIRSAKYIKNKNK